MRSRSSSGATDRRRGLGDRAPDERRLRPARGRAHYGARTVLEDLDLIIDRRAGGDPGTQRRGQVEPAADPDRARARARGRCYRWRAAQVQPRVAARRVAVVPGEVTCPSDARRGGVAWAASRTCIPPRPPRGRPLPSMRRSRGWASASSRRDARGVTRRAAAGRAGHGPRAAGAHPDPRRADRPSRPAPPGRGHGAVRDLNERDGVGVSPSSTTSLWRRISSPAWCSSTMAAWSPTGPPTTSSR